MNRDEIKKQLQGIIDAYNNLVSGIDNRARESNDRAYGGIIRAGKGKLVESIAEQLVRIAWQDLGRNENELNFVNHTIKIPINKQYLKQIKSPEVRKYIKKNISIMYYRIKPDVQVCLNNEFKLSIECKAYTENAMLKRILVDCTLIKQVYQNVKFILLQLESQLGGDYSQIFKEIQYGSPSTHTLLSYFDIDLNIITLLEGERKIDQPIHKQEFFKPLKIESLYNALNIIKSLMI
ncbi:MAG: restriction endonuclease [Candidatus Helarchaeota archaeon]